MSSSVIVLEFNELAPGLIDRFISQGDLPNFARLRGESLVAVTDAEEAPPNLEPWIQWVTVHSGRSFAEHGVFNLSEGGKFSGPRIWDIVSDAGRPVWICGSMNAVFRDGPLNGLFLPDPWSTDVKPYPEAFFRPYMNLVAKYIQEHSRDRVPVSKQDYLRFARFMLGNGLSLHSIKDALAQLMDERRSGRRYRRASILDELQWDLFASQYRRLKPALATFFLNSTAHFQHYYWRNFEPDAFAAKPSIEEQDKYADAILFGYRKMDAIVGHALKLAGPDTSIVLATGLSQQPLLKYEAEGGRLLFRPRDVLQLLRLAGIGQSCDYEPVMAEEFYLRFRADTDRADAHGKLATLRLGSGESVLRIREEASASLLVACNVNRAPPLDMQVIIPLTGSSLPFAELFYPMDAVKSGMHHPDGVLWLRTPQKRHARIARKISLRQIAPTLLELCGIDSDSCFPLPALPEISPTERRPSAAA